jgi:tRNA-specific adenosine deaminase 3
MKGYMQQTISLLKLGKSEDLPIAAILVNPKTGQVLLTSHDTRISTKHPLNHSIMLLLRQLPSLLPSRMDSATITSDEEDTQYYANMYDVYITHEPCQMCCMALVHSRIRRLIFWKGMDTGARALGWMKGDETELLNHRYMCFEGIPGALSEDAEIEDLGSQVHV